MPPFGALALLTIAGGFALLYALGGRWIERPAGDRMAHWRRAAREAGLAQVEETLTALTGRAGELHVRLARYEKAHGYGTLVTVTGPGLPKDLSIRLESRRARMGGAHDVEAGEPGFDDAVQVLGAPALVRALLDAETRRGLKALAQGRLEQPGRATFWASGTLEAGVLRVEVPEVTPQTAAERNPWLAPEEEQSQTGCDAVAGRERMPEALERVLALARRLAPPGNVPRRVAENLKGEPEAGVRLRLLTTLVREFADLPLTREALLAARDDPDAEVRLRAGIALGPEGTDTLVRLAHGEGAEDSTTERAVAALGERLTTPQALSILRGALRTRHAATARACIGVLGTRGGEEEIAMLARVLAVEGPELAAAAAAALASAQATSAEPALVAALGREETKVRIAAATALGAVGTLAAVSRLKDAEAHDAPLRSAARQAIAAIQSRLPGAAPGQLSLAGGEAGRLSLAVDAGGRLSLFDKED